MIGYARPGTVEELSAVIRDASQVTTGSGPYSLPSPIGAAAQATGHQQGIEQIDSVIHPDDATRREAVFSDWEAQRDAAMAQCERLGGVRDGAMWVSTARMFRTLEYHPADQVVVVQASQSLAFLQSDLAEQGQCLPLGEGTYKNWALGTAIDFNLPHTLEAQCGSWRDWVLGMKIVLADGSIVKCGSRAVKNVAGYDLQKLIIGARGTLGIIAEVTLKTFPLKARPEPNVIWRKFVASSPLWIQRVAHSDFGPALRRLEDKLVVADPASATLWVQTEKDLPRYPGDWVIRRGCGEKNLQITDPTVIRYMTRAKELFDPTHKLNPGAMGIF